MKTINAYLLLTILLPLLLTSHPVLSQQSGEHSSENHSSSNKSAQALFKVINQRLGYMQDVALFKAQNQLAIENLPREKVVLDAAVKNATTAGLNARQVRGFFRAQINAAKAIQYRYRAKLLTDPVEKLPPDLNGHIRPALIKLGDKIIRSMTAHIKQFGSFEKSQKELFFAIVNNQLLSSSDKQKLFNGLIAISLE